MHPISLRRGLYLITPEEADATRLLERVLPVLTFVSCLQLRNKVIARIPA